MSDNHLVELATTWEQSGHVYTVRRDYYGRPRWYLRIVTLHHFQDAETAHAFRKTYGGSVGIRRDGFRVWSITNQDDQKHFLETMRDQIPDGIAGPLIDSALRFLSEPPELREELAEIVRVTNLYTTRVRKTRRRHVYR